jgi:hypothetical protein
MNIPQLYQRCPQEQAAAFLGLSGAGHALCDGDWLIFPDAALCFAVVDKWPARSHADTHSHFKTASRFCWTTKKRHQACDDAHFPFLPAEVRANHTLKRPIFLFVRRRDWRDYLYVGRLGPSHAWGGSKTGPWAADFDLSPALPSQIWFFLRGESSAAPDSAALDAALARLRLPTTPDERFAVLRAVVEYWHGTIGAADGIAEGALAGVAMPSLLRRWYSWAGNRRDIMSGQNIFLAPEKLRIEDGRLVFYFENQGCYTWATLPEGDDPPVFGRVDNAAPWGDEGMALSEHLILTALFEGIMVAPYGASAAWVTEGTRDQIAAVIEPLAVPPWRWLGPTQFHGKAGAFMVSMANGDVDGKSGYSLWIGAKTQEPLLFLRPFLDDGWDYVAV